MKKMMIAGMLMLAGVVILTGFSTGTARGQAAKQDSSFSFLYNSVKSEPDPSKMAFIVAIMEKRVAGSNGNSFLMEYCRQLTAVAFAKEGNVEKAGQWINRIGEESARDQAVLGVAEELTARNELPEAEKILLPAWEKLKKVGRKTDTGSKDAFTQGPGVDDFAYQYGVILYKKGAYKESLQYLAPEEGRKRGAGEHYAIALANVGEADKALDVMSRIIFSQPHTSEAFNEAARKVFVKKHGSEKRYDQLLDSAALIWKKKMEEKVAVMAVNIPAPDFQLTDLNGKTVSLESLRGKTVILDFWATWCQPCVASFPGMQKAVDYYRNDTSIVFMFIHTSEKKADPIEDVRQFMAYKKYRFDVFMDLKNPSTGKSDVAASFGVRGIPAKFVIDKNGMIKYKNSGFVSEEEAIPEIKTMVDSISK